MGWVRSPQVIGTNEMSLLRIMILLFLFISSVISIIYPSEATHMLLYAFGSEYKIGFGVFIAAFALILSYSVFVKNSSASKKDKM